jgi:hypothetical protein
VEVTFKLWYYRELSLTGKENLFYGAAQNVTESATSASILAVLLLAALGWSLTRDELTSRESRLFIVIFSLYFFLALIKANCHADNDLCKAYLLTEYVMKSFLMLGVIVALNFSVNQLRLLLTEARWNSYMTPVTYMKLNQYQ